MALAEFHAGLFYLDEELCLVVEPDGIVHVAIFDGKLFGNLGKEVIAEDVFQEFADAHGGFIVYP